MIDLADPNTDVVKLYKDFKEWVIAKHNDDYKELLPIHFKYNVKPSVIEVYYDLIFNWLCDMDLETYAEEDIKIINQLIFIWHKSSFVQKIRHNNDNYLKLLK